MITSAKMPAKSSSVSMLPLALRRSLPTPFSEATNSPTSAPTIARVMETFMPPKMTGSALGRRTSQNSWSLLAPAARDVDLLDLGRLQPDHRGDEDRKEGDEKGDQHLGQQAEAE